MNYEFELFPIVEIREHSIKFEVIRYIGDQALIIFENTYYGDGTEILNHDGTVKDIVTVSKILEKSFDAFEKKFIGMKIKEVGIVVPNNISITKKTIKCNLLEEDNVKTKSPVTLDLIMKIKKKINDSKIEQNIKVLDNKISELSVDNKIIKLNNLENVSGKRLTINTSIVEMEGEIFESHAKPIIRTGRKVL